MSAVCSICRREDRPAIEQSHVEGLSLRAIAKLHPGTTAWSLRRHFQHVPMIIEQQQKLQERQVQSDRITGKLPARVEQLLAELERITVNALRRKDPTTALRAIAQRRECLKTIGELSGELRPGGAGEVVPANVQVNIGEPSTQTEPALSEEERRDRFLAKFAHCYGVVWPRKPKTDTVM